MRRRRRRRAPQAPPSGGGRCALNGPLTVGRLFEQIRGTLQLEQVGGPCGLDREVKSSDVSSPGLALAGYVNRFPYERLQVFGETEVTYLRSLDDAERERVLGLYFSFAIPCIFITKGQELPPGLGEHAAAAGIPVLRSTLKTNEFYRRLKPILEEEFAPTTTLHGSLADIFGVGLLFVGKSGIGKSECVLDLVERGHRLVADDLVITTRRGNDVLIDVPAIFGIRAVRQQKRIEVVVQLEEWDQKAVVDRTGLDGQTTTILDVPIPKITVPLNPGKNITVIAEVIAMNHLLRYSGHDAAEAFNRRLIGRMRDASDVRGDVRTVPPANVREYLQEDDE